MRFPWNRRRREQELDEELASHLRMAVAERVARGETPAAAERAARREFGNLGVVREVTRETWGGGWLERLAQDVRYGARTLRRSPAFSITAGLTLALGVGATTAVFTVVNGVLLRPLPYPESDRLALLSYQPKDTPWSSAPGLADADWLSFHRGARLFERMGAASAQLVTLTGAGDPVRLPGAAVSADFFATLGVRIARGRAFSVDEETDGRNRVAMIGHALWRDRFGGDSNIVGRAILLDGVSHTVVGVLPPGLAYPFGAQVWRPLVIRVSPNLSFMLSVVARLRDGVTSQQAAAEIASVAGGAQPHSPGQAPRVAEVIPLKDTVIGNARRSLLVFAGAVGLVLLIACANVANLLLMRAAGRHREMALRTALGAPRRRLIRQLVTESMLLWIVAGALGAAMSVAGVRALLALAPSGRIPRQNEIGVDLAAFAFALGVSLLTGLAFGLVPALRATRPQLRESLAASSRGVSSRDGGVRSALVMAEIALAIVLLAGAGLMTRSFVRMRQLELGFRPSGLVTMTVDLPAASYASATAMRQFHEVTLAQLSRLPGVTSAAAVNFSPLGGALVQGDFQLTGGRSRPNGFLAAKPSVSPGYFRTMGIRLLQGREFTAEDGARAPGVVVVSRRVADAVWPGENALGRQLSMKDKPGPGDWLTVVGVVEDIAQRGLNGERDAAIYRPTAQLDETFFLEHMTFVARAADQPEPVLTGMRQVLRAVDRNLAVASIGTMDATISATVEEPLFQARLIGVFSAFALLLAAIGIYGVVAYSVAERTHEIGIRVALGAVRTDVASLVVRRVLVLVVPGVVLGIGGALAVTRVLASLLFEVKPNDPATLAAVAVLVLATAAVAALVPARRATRVDPLIALRSD
ncbi:MAG TPA: ABC transporter permease [Gemmatimonadaceae bacterium]|nr:ABC transporter permease [Gemmatimonadaceae bacterium]